MNGYIIVWGDNKTVADLGNDDVKFYYSRQYAQEEIDEHLSFDWDVDFRIVKAKLEIESKNVH